MAVYEALTCGNTEIQAHDLRSIMHRLSTVDKRQKRTGYALEFQRLEAVTSQNSQENFDIGLAKENTKKNRYPNIVATNGSRVILSTDETENKADYVNAASIFDLVDGAKGDYINASFVHVSCSGELQVSYKNSIK
ncbi:receptor-type tyrosine-protein phosphatase S-like [Actinia tenebrosa]|uniref:Receptor-type tyrosine-protein phosphatase S-like n=1 Tax=Actinia tenebrosa TaxID=6105 RepID=A0A6P8HIJ7_ACTTE|nr:receptor-type tyrosine-protein phosphatase S-like [Actinia tenebrosa]